MLKILFFIVLMFFALVGFNPSNAENPESNIIYTDRDIEKYKPPDLPKKEPENHINIQSDNKPNEDSSKKAVIPALGYPSGVPVKPRSESFKPVLKNPIIPLVTASVIDVSAELRGKSPK